MRSLPHPLAQQALSVPTAFVRAVTIVLTRGLNQVIVEPDDGTFTQDARRSMRWDGTFTVADQSLIPTTPGDILTPFGTRASVVLGIRVGDVESQVSFGQYIIVGSQAEVSPNTRSVTVDLIDLSEAVAQYRFETPYTVAGGADLADAVADVVHDRSGVFHELAPTGITLTRQRIFGLDPETDPWRELQELVAGFGMRIWYDRDGNLVLDAEPTADKANAVDLAGPLSATGVFERRPPNVVVARGEPAEDTPPVQAVAMDLDEASPTWAGAIPGDSPYGRITRYYASPLLTTETQAQAAADTILSRSAGAGAAWEVGRAFDPTWDPDDIVRLDLLGLPLILVVDAVTVALTEGTTLVCREPVELIDTTIPITPPEE